MNIQLDRVLVLPLSDWNEFSWPAKSTFDRVVYGLDLSAWLLVNGLTIDHVEISATSGLNVDSFAYIVDPISTRRAGVQIELTGGVSGNTESVVLQFNFTDGQSRTVIIDLPIIQLPADLVPVVADATQVLEIGPNIIDISAEPIEVGPQYNPDYSGTG